MEVFWSLPAQRGTPCALTIGKFDGVHLGHRSIIYRLIAAAVQRGLPACALTFDPHPVEFFLKERAPTRLTTLPEKVRLLAESGLDRLYVCPFDQRVARMSPQSFVQDLLVGQLGARWLLVGNDFRFGEGRTADVKTLRTLGEPSGLEVATTGLLQIDGRSVSSTSIRKAMSDGEWDVASRLLGREATLPSSGACRQIKAETAVRASALRRSPKRGIHQRILMDLIDSSNFTKPVLETT